MTASHKPVVAFFVDQAAFPYADLVETGRRRGRHEFEYELIASAMTHLGQDTGTGGTRKMVTAYSKAAAQTRGGRQANAVTSRQGPAKEQVGDCPDFRAAKMGLSPCGSATDAGA